MKIGFTERGDGGLDLSWLDKAKTGKCDGVVVISKNLNLRTQAAIYECWNNICPIIVHADCTGWGGSAIEPYVPKPATQLHNICDMLLSKFPADHIVLRIDPIFPTPKGLERVHRLVDAAVACGILPQCRCRVSIFDEYKHVKERFRSMGYEPMYGDSFAASDKMMHNTAALLNELHTKYGIVFETCAEHKLAQLCPEACREQGCLSRTDLEIMGFKYENTFENPQSRNGCHCLGCKTELLENKHPCKHGCKYCYWRD